MPSRSWQAVCERRERPRLFADKSGVRIAVSAGSVNMMNQAVSAIRNLATYTASSQPYKLLIGFHWGVNALPPLDLQAMNLGKEKG